MKKIKDNKNIIVIGGITFLIATQSLCASTLTIKDKKILSNNSSNKSNDVNGINDGSRTEVSEKPGKDN